MTRGTIVLPDDGHVKEGGWGANHDATKWEVINMNNPPELFKVIDGNGDNVADRFKEQANAQQFIEYHRFKQAECEAQDTEEEVHRWDYLQEKCISHTQGTGGTGEIDVFGVEKLFADAKSSWKDASQPAINWSLTTGGDPNDDPHLKDEDGKKHFDDYKGTDKFGKMQYYTGKNESWRTDLMPSRGKQKRTWKDEEELEDTGCLGSGPGARAFEMTAYIRVDGINKSEHEAISFKVRGGSHGKPKPDPHASCTEIVYNYDDDDNDDTAARELSHADYDRIKVKPRFEGGMKDGEWVGFKCTSWNESYTGGNLKNVVNRLYVNKDPLNNDGTPKNNFKLWLEWTDKDGERMGEGDGNYKTAAWWTGWMETIRIDATDKVDIGYYSYREIDPTNPLTDRSNPSA